MNFPPKSKCKQTHTFQLQNSTWQQLILNENVRIFRAVHLLKECSLQPGEYSLNVGSNYLMNILRCNYYYESIRSSGKMKIDCDIHYKSYITWIKLNWRVQSVSLIETSKTRYILYISRWSWSASAGAEGYQAKSTCACEVRAGKNLKVRRACVRWKISCTPILCNWDPTMIEITS